MGNKMRKYLLIIYTICTFLMFNNSLFAESSYIKEYNVSNTVIDDGQLRGESVEYLKKENITKEESVDYLLSIISNGRPQIDLSLEDIGYKYSNDAKVQLSCSDSLINGSYLNNKNKENETIADKIVKDISYFSAYNRGLLRVFNMNLIEEYGEGEISEEDRVRELVTGLSMLMQHGLYDIDSLKELINKSSAAPAIKEKLLEKAKSNNLDIEKISELLDFAYEFANFDGKTAADYFNKFNNTKYLKYIAFQEGSFDIYGDSFYDLVKIIKHEEFSVLAVLERNTLDEKYDYMYARYFKQDNESGKGIDYPALHCNNNVYSGHLYIFPFAGMTYIVNTTEIEHLLKTMETRNYRFFNTDYEKNYFAPVIFKDSADEKVEKLHKISRMSSFSYKDNIIYEMEYDRDAQSPIGDADKVKFRKGKKINIENIRKDYKAKIFKGKDYNAELAEYVSEHLQKFSTKKLLNEVDFYDISLNKNEPAIIAYGYYLDEHNNKKEQVFILNRKNFKVLDKNIAKTIDDFITSDDYYKTLISNNGNTSLVSFIKRSNEVLVVNIENNKIGSGTFPIYYYKSKKVKTDKFNDIKEMKSIAGGIYDPVYHQCHSMTGIASISNICKNRGMLAARNTVSMKFHDYIDRITNRGYYNSIIEGIKEEYYKIDDLIVEKCTKAENKDECVMDNILEFIELFSR